MLKLLGIATIITSLSLSSFSFADGAVSGGGGGLINPDRVDDRTVEDTIHRYTGIVLTAWLRKQEIDFSKLKKSDQANSPFRKLFDAKGTVYRLIRETSVEARTNGACLDANGLEKDGSILANAPHAICISVSRIAAKLTSSDVQAETMALEAHEYSHLMGTTEDEAVAIQKAALLDFTRRDFEDIETAVFNVKSLVDAVDIFHLSQTTAAATLRAFSQGEVNRISRSQMIAVKTMLDSLGNSVLLPGSRFEVLPLSISEKFAFPENAFAGKLSAETAIYSIGYFYLCSTETTLDDGLKKDCAASLDVLFPKGTETITAQRWAQLVTDDVNCINAPDSCFGNKFKEIQVSRPHSLEDARKLFARVDQDITAIAAEISRMVACVNLGNELSRNCGEPRNLPRYQVRKTISGAYDVNGHSFTCEGAVDGRYLRDATCQVQNGLGISELDSMKDYRIQLHDQSGKLQWDCIGYRWDGDGITPTMTHRTTCSLAWNLDDFPR